MTLEEYLEARMRKLADELDGNAKRLVVLALNERITPLATELNNRNRLNAEALDDLSRRLDAMEAQFHHKIAILERANQAAFV